VQTFERLQDAFPAENGTAAVVIEASDVTSPSVTKGIDELRASVGEQGDLFPDSRKTEVEISKDKSVATVWVGIAGDGQERASKDAVEALRDDVIPATIGKVDGTQASVNGMTAEELDFNDTLMSHLPLVVGFVIVAAFLLLLVTFRSIVVPIKAIILNLLSVGAAYGVMTLIFNKGVGKELLGFEHTGPITGWIPMFMFVILFGLSMDYHVFILSRVREAFDRGMKTEDAVAHGIKTTAGVVSSAALVMVGVFSIFATLPILDMKEMGIGLAAAVLIDATIVRAVLLPATMKLLGDWNWYLPRWLSWLPELEHERSERHGEPALGTA
jgi:uncharacterized membrane protein YdfJ with MMPL/SSD domain